MSRLYVFDGKLHIELDADDFTPQEIDALREWKATRVFVDTPEQNALEEPATGGGGTGDAA